MKSRMIVWTLISIGMFAACAKTETIQTALISPTEISYKSVDSMKLDSAYRQNGSVNFALFSQVNNKQYIVNNNRAGIFYDIQIGDFMIFIQDTNTNGLVNKLRINFGNKTINNIAGTYDFNTTNVCLKWEQGLNALPALSVFSIGCDISASGKITLQADVTNNTISGQIENLKYKFGYYIPLYQNGNIPQQNLPDFLVQSGSTRNQEITFKYVKKQ